MKTKEELNKLKAEYEALSIKLRELTEDELKQVVGGNNDITVEEYNTWEIIPTI